MSPNIPVCYNHISAKKGCCPFCEECKKCPAPDHCLTADLHIVPNSKGRRRSKKVTPIQTPPTVQVMNGLSSSIRSPCSFTSTSLNHDIELVLNTKGFDQSPNLTSIQTPPTVQRLSRSSSNSRTSLTNSQLQGYIMNEELENIQTEELFPTLSRKETLESVLSELNLPIKWVENIPISSKNKREIKKIVTLLQLVVDSLASLLMKYECETPTLKKMLISKEMEGV